MNIKEKKKVIDDGIISKSICNIYFKYDKNYFNLIPLLAGEELFLNANEDDFIINGYTVRRFCDIKKVKCKDDKCKEILMMEEIKINIPKISITSWETLFIDLQTLSRNIIIQHESLNGHKYQFFIGKIEEVFQDYVIFKHFDADGIWEENSHKIIYDEITSVSFDTRYINVFSKYI